MKLKYKLLGNQKGVLLDRIPELTEELIIHFENAPKDSTAIILNEQGQSVYRKLSDNSCNVDMNKFNGVVRITVFSTVESLKSIKWKCDEIIVKKTSEKTFLVYPNDINLMQLIAQMRMEIQELKEFSDGFKTMMDELKKNQNKLSHIFDTNSLNFLIKKET